MKLNSPEIPPIYSESFLAPCVFLPYLDVERYRQYFSFNTSTGMLRFHFHTSYGYYREIDLAIQQERNGGITQKGVMEAHHAERTVYGYGNFNVYPHRGFPIDTVSLQI